MENFKFLTTALLIGLMATFMVSCREMKENSTAIVEESSNEMNRFVNAYYQEKAEILISGKVPSTFKARFATEELYTQMVATILDRKQYLADNGLAYTHYKGKVLLDEAVKPEVMANATIVKMQILEQLALTTNQVDIETKKGIITEEALEHELELVPTEGTFLIKSEKRIHTEVELADVEMPTNGVSVELPSLEKLSAVNYTYSGTNARDYAYLYVGTLNSSSSTGYNSSYRAYSPTDCTNFLSQCLKYGGWAYKNAYSNATSSSSWWYNTNATTGDTYSWKNANGFNAFMAASGRGSLTSNVLNLNIGDVLMADWFDNTTTCTCNGTWNHSMLVTCKSSSDVFLTYHSTNRKDKSFLDLRYETRCTKSGTTYYSNFNRWNINSTGI
jgi:hypothetical protein